MTAHQPRTPAGSPDGGQYAPKAGAGEADSATLTRSADDDVATFHIVTSNGTRPWQADTLEHALEQHELAFGDDERVLASYKACESSSLLDPLQPRIYADVSCQAGGDGYSQPELVEVRHVDVTDIVMALPPRERMSLMDGALDRWDAQAHEDRLRADGRLNWDGPTKVHLAESFRDYSDGGSYVPWHVGASPGRVWAIGWDASGTSVTNSEAKDELMRLAGDAHALTDNKREAIEQYDRAHRPLDSVDMSKMSYHEAEQYESQDVKDPTRDAFVAACASLEQSGWTQESVERLWEDADRMSRRYPNSQDVTSMAFGDAAVAVAAHKQVGKAGSPMTLEHYDALIGPVRHGTGDHTPLCSNPIDRAEAQQGNRP